MSDNFYVQVLSGNNLLYHERGNGVAGDNFILNKPEFALGMVESFARARAGLYRGFQYRARVVQAQSRDQLDHAVVIVDFDEDIVPKDKGLTLRDNFTKLTYRDVFEGRHLELPLLLNRSLSTYFLTFTTSTNPLDPRDVSISGKTPLECFQKFTQNPIYWPYHDRFSVEPLPIAAPVLEQIPPGTPMIQLPDGTRMSVRLTT